MDIHNENLELVDNVFTDEEHEKLNAELSTFSTGNFALTGPLLLLLLQGIIRQLGPYGSDEYLAFEPGLNLIERNPTLRNMLLAGLRDCNFNAVRRLKILRKAAQSESKSNSNKITSTSAAQVAWNHVYLGTYHRTIWNIINTTDWSITHANCIALIQGSGCGKSRTVDEMAKLVFTIPINLRNPNEELMEGAYPPQDTGVWKYFCRSEIRSVDHGEDFMSLFFQYLFSEVNAEVKRIFSGVHPPQEFAQQWRRHLLGRNVLSELYARVMQTCQNNHMCNPRQSDDLMTNLADLLATVERLCAFPESQRDNVKIVLYIDEAHELSRKIPNAVKNLHDIVWSTLVRFRNASVFTVFLSTQSSLSLLTPSPESTRSGRQRSKEVLWGPVTEMPFDCHPSFPLQSGQYSLADVQLLEFLTRFGRPLFWTMLCDSKAPDRPTLLADMMALARKKLVFHNKIDDPLAHGLVAWTAVLDVLITIEYEPRRELARDWQEAMVASHMRIAYSVPYHRSYMHSGYPSEPFLAEAASRQMLCYLRHPVLKTNMAGILQINVQNGLIDLGENGEVVMRLLLRKAYMDTIVAEQGLTDPNFSKGCSFLGFLKSLFAQGFHSSILGSQPDNQAASLSALSDVFGRAVVRFTHFAKAADESAMSTRGMSMAFLRGAAIMCHNNQKIVDIAIPILLDEEHKIQEASMSAFLIQVKRRHRAGAVNAYLIDAKKLGFFPKGSAVDARPYVTLVAELGVEAPPPGMHHVAISPRSKHRSECKASQLLQSKNENPRYSMRAYTCTDETYGVIDSSEVILYRQILCVDTLLADHPRQDKECLQLVRQMLPFWYQHAAWFSDEAILQGHVAGPHEDSESDESDDDMVVEENV